LNSAEADREKMDLLLLLYFVFQFVPTFLALLMPSKIYLGEELPSITGGASQSLGCGFLAYLAVTAYALFCTKEGSAERIMSTFMVYLYGVVYHLGFASLVLLRFLMRWKVPGPMDTQTSNVVIETASHYMWGIVCVYVVLRLQKQSNSPVTFVKNK